MITVAQQAEAAAVDAAKVRSLVTRRFDGDARVELLAARFGPGETPTTTTTVAPRREASNEGTPLAEETKAAVRELIEQGRDTSAIAEQLGVSRQAVSGVRTAVNRARRKDPR